MVDTLVLVLHGLHCSFILISHFPLHGIGQHVEVIYSSIIPLHKDQQSGEQVTELNLLDIGYLRLGESVEKYTEILYCITPLF